MAVISMADFLEKRLLEKSSLTDLLTRAKSIAQKEDGSKDLICLKTVEVKKFFEARLNALLLREGVVQSDAFLCAIYIAKILADTHADVPDSFYAMDYFNRWLKTGKSLELKRGADVCFILCSFFPERCERRTMKLDDYVGIGSGLYYRYYNQANKEIAYHMGNLFEPMSRITARCLEC